MVRLTWIIAFFFAQTAYSQVDLRGNTSIETHRIQSDTVNNSPYKQFEKRIKLAPIDQSTAQIDVRLYTRHALSNTVNLRRLYKKDLWQATEYDEWNKPISIKNYSLVVQPSFDSLFALLLANDIMSLPDQKEVRTNNEKTEVTEDGEVITKKMIHVMDGYSYTIEIKVGQVFRIYQFDNPEVYAKHYDTIPEFKKYANIVEVFKRTCNEKLITNTIVKNCRLFTIFQSRITNKLRS